MYLLNFLKLFLHTGRKVPKKAKGIVIIEFVTHLLSTAKRQTNFLSGSLVVQ